MLSRVRIKILVLAVLGFVSLVSSIVASFRGDGATGGAWLAVALCAAILIELREHRP